MITWVDRLKREYAKGKRQLEAYRKTLDSADPVIAEESELVSDMIASLQFGITYMHTGRYPGAVRGIDRRSAYQRSIILDTELFPSLMVDVEPESEISKEDKRKLVDILCRLSTRERQCFILNASYGLSYAEVAKELKISKGVAQTYINRARAKVGQGSMR
jgi:RNA polymerase sigma factor (sigma-70 family)